MNGGAIGDELDASIKKAKEINYAVTKFINGEETSLNEWSILAENGGKNYTGGDIYKAMDFLAMDNPDNISARNNFIKAREKQKKGEKLTVKEKADISNYRAREYIRKSIAAENTNIITAVDLYNDAVYKEGAEKIFAQMKLYVNTGMTKYLQNTINSGAVFLTERAYNWGLSEKRASDVLKDISQSKYEIANNAVGQYFAKNDMKFSKFVQDTTVSLANNMIPMLLGGLSVGTSLAATSLSVFGGSYGEAIKLAPDADEWQYWLYAGVNTAAEVYMEKFLSGDKNIFENSGSDFSEKMFKELTKNVSNKTLLKGAHILSNTTGEWLEESIQGLLSPILQEELLGVDAISILSANKSERSEAVKNAMYDGFVGFASAGITTGLLGSNAIQSIEQKKVVGAYYKRTFNDLKVDVKNIAVYLKEISNGKNVDLYKSAENVLNGDKSDSAIADMMLKGFEQSQEAQRFVYTKIGERLNQDNRYMPYNLLRQYDKLRRKGIELSQSITETYEELINANENTNKEKTNYLVGKLSTTIDAVIPRASLSAEVEKNVSSEIEEKGLQHHMASHNYGRIDKIDSEMFIDGLWDTGKDNEYDDSAESVEKRDLEKVDKVDESWYNDKNVIIDGSHLVDGKLKSNIKYKSGEYDYIYFTDDLGRINDFYTEELQYTKRNKRLRHNPNVLEKKKGDHAGHLIADRFGGSPDIDNLVSQSALVNLSEYKVMENLWAKALKNGQKVGVSIKVQYEGNSMRPSGFVINYTVDGKRFNKNIYN